MLNRATAQELHDTAKIAGVMVIWIVSSADPEHPGKVTARPHTADAHGEVLLVGVLVADTPAQLRAMKPVGLTVRPRDPFHMPEILETWD